MSRLHKLSTFFKQNLLGLFIFALLSSIAASLLYERFISSPKEPDAKAKSRPEARSEIAIILDGCYHVPPGIARFVVIPTTPTKLAKDFELRFTGLLSKSVAVTRHAVISEGLEKAALKVYRGKYTLVLADPATRQVISSLSTMGINAFDVEKRSVDEALVAFFLENESPNNIDWSSKGLTPALSGKCNLLNLVILPDQNS